MLTMCCGLMLTALSACSAIDEDLSDCGDDSVEMNYELELVTNISTELNTELSLQTDVQLSANLRQQLATIFTDYAHDVDLSFYDVQGDSIRLEHDKHLMNANQASYTLNIPRRHYMHIALANIGESDLITLEDDDYCHRSHLQQLKADTIDSHTTGLFCGREAMNIREGIDQTFNVLLFMVNCASALVIDTVGSGISNLQVYATGFASRFQAADSLYIFDKLPPIVRPRPVATGNDSVACFSFVNFPSREVLAGQTRTVIETTDPFVSIASEEGLWQYHVYATLNDGTVTRSVLNVFKPLRAGQFKIVKAHINRQGVADTSDHQVGVSVTLNWNDGVSHEVPL